MSSRPTPALRRGEPGPIKHRTVDHRISSVSWVPDSRFAASGMTAATSQHLIDIELHRILLPCAARQRQNPIEPVRRWMRGLEAHHGAEIIERWIDLLALREACQNVRRT